MRIGFEVVLKKYTKQLSLTDTFNASTHASSVSRGLGRRKTNSLVLTMFIIILLVCAQFWTSINSSQRSTSVNSGTKRFVSSAYLKILLILDLGLRSLSRIRYKVGPSQEPWTMLWLIAAGVDSPADVLVVWFLPERNEMSQFRMHGGRGRQLSLPTRTAWSTTSNARTLASPAV